MKAYAIALIAASGSVIAAVMILGCLCVVRNKKKKQTSRPDPIGTKSLGTTSTPSAQRAYPAWPDIEIGEGTKKSSETIKDGGMVSLAGANATQATTTC
ncbi:hypothetical protein TorRG33x02_285060 [Trema orientale]|uniref:Transmembrane protein n=1 Tax=Trema orientale TaxID=63057 RepID=A0A2P5CGX4_TREOI|nr:hypothetical protein TorRG33x02_285060 [Trema orientale]